MSSEEDDIASIEMEDAAEEDVESLVSDDGIEPGGANSDRTKCKCQCCEKVHYLDSSWTYETHCPSCEDSIFSYLCGTCMSYNCYGSDEPAFPGQPCAECGRTQEEEEEEDQCQERLRDEKIRVSNGANFRAAKTKEPFPIYQNKICLTYQALYGRAKPGTPPVSEADALRMSDDDWESVRPMVVAELEDGSVLNVKWCKHQIQVFERSWQSDNMAALERGTIEDWTGKPHMLVLPSIEIGIRSLREAQMEEGTLPIAPIVKIDEDAWYKSSEYGGGKRLSSEPLSKFVTWGDVPDNFNEDPREIYRLDGNKTMTLFEFLIWSARVGGFAGQEPNPKWNIEDCTQDFNRRGLSTIEPIAYVPTDWVGRPKSFAEDMERWHWLQEQIRKGDFVDGMSEFNAKLEANMKLCSRCYGPPKDGRTNLIFCECKSAYWCSEECKNKSWELHILDHRNNHKEEVTRVCLECGKKGGNELLRCGRCKNAFFCNAECQKDCWNACIGHKAECREYSRERGGRQEWSSVA